MAVPKRKTTPHRRGIRRANTKMNVRNINVIENSTTGELHRPHHVSPDGYYRNRQVTDQPVNT